MPVRENLSIAPYSGFSFSALKWLALVLLALLSALLGAISLFWGPTHWAIAGLLAAAWLVLVALLVVGPSRFGLGRTHLSVALGFVGLAFAAVVISQLSAYTPAITGNDGKPVPGSIASLERVSLNSTQQWLSIRGKSTGNPVLLWLSGGPGGSQLATERYHLGGLEDRFVVVDKLLGE